MSDLNNLDVYLDCISSQGSKPEPTMYPKKCVSCGNESVEASVIRDYQSEWKLHGVVRKFTVPVLRVERCQHCGEEFFNSLSDDDCEAVLAPIREQIISEECRPE